MDIVWKQFKNNPAARRLRCRNCDSIAMEVKSEPVKRKVHTRSSHKRRIVAICLKCRATKQLAYGGTVGGKQ
jgi:RNase P subunit RPR2